MSEIIRAPFTEEQVKNLNEYQNLGIVHEYTCRNEHYYSRVLIATTQGWICPNCDYKQSWAFASTTNIQEMKETWNQSEFGKIKKL